MNDEGRRGAGVSLRGPEGFFVIDDQQRIVEWSDATSALLGVPANLALGRHCHEVVLGRDPFGREVCQSPCTAFEALKRGRLTARSSLTIPKRAGARLRLQCELMALPRIPGGAIVWVRDRTPTILATEGEGSVDAHPPARGELLRALATLAMLSTSISTSTIHQSLEVTLDVLREATGADSAEIFLAEPVNHEMLLTAHAGLFRSAFSQIIRFKPGEGFPGLVLTRQEPILTNTLAEDARYLRTKVKERGFHSYLCVPLWSKHRVMGSLNVASRREDFDLEGVSRLLTWASVPLSTALEASIIQLRQGMNSQDLDPNEASEGRLDHLLQGILQHMLTLADADGGALIVLNRQANGVAHQAILGAASGVRCRELYSGSNLACPALIGGSGIVRYGPRHSWPLPCRVDAQRGAVTYCLPMPAAGQPIGLIQIAYRHPGPWPATRRLSLLLEMAAEAARLVKKAQNHLEQRHRAELIYRQRLQVETETLAKRRAQMAYGQTQEGFLQKGSQTRSEPYLVFQCLGPFEVYRQGVLMTPQMFQRRKALTLLKILLAYEGHPVTKDTLMELLWPETDPESGANRLYVVVHALRRAIEPSGPDQEWVFVRNQGDCYYFNSRAPYCLDVEEFLRNLDLGQKAERDGSLEVAIAAYDAAIQLYRGDFLEDEPFEEWSWMKREHLRETLLNTLGKVGALCVAVGYLERGIAYYRRALRMDPLREEIHRKLIRCLGQARRRDEALRQYEVCRDILQRELGIAPLPETEEVVKHIRSEWHG